MTYAWLLPALPLTASATTVVDDKFADGDSQNQDLENNSLRLSNGSTTTVRTDQAGWVTFDVTATLPSPAMALAISARCNPPSITFLRATCAPSP